MQINAITVNAAGMTAAGQGIQGNRSQVMSEDNIFGPECKVTISREGRKLSGQQATQTETGVQNTQSVKEERMLLRQQTEAELSKEIREGYRERLNEIDKQITDYNTSYAKTEMSQVVYDVLLMDKTVEEQQKLRTAMQNQKQFQIEEGQRRVKEAQQMAMQSAQYKEEIDENNRDLLTLLKTMEEAEKSEEEQENDGVKDDGNSTSDVIQNSAVQFMASSVNRERIVEEMLAGLEDSGRWFIDTADSIAKNVLQRSSDIRAALDDESFTDEQLAEMIDAELSGRNGAEL